jgi:thiol-disulfide isomerase/thioredoxin
MKLFYLQLLIATIPAQFSCNSVDTNSNIQKDITIISSSDSAADQTFTPDWKMLTKNFMTWYNYTYYNIRLSQDFIGLDIDSSKIDKAIFLHKLMTENVVVFKTKVLKGQSVYQLFKLNTNDEGIKATIKEMAATAMAHFKMEGMEIPEFNFTDLKGKVYTKSSTKGKIIVLKCWLIHCVACVKEFPELNKLVEEYQEKNDIVFVSLALDTKDKLEKFLANRTFKYATVPNMQQYITQKLNTTAYPTHILINRNGKIVKVVNKIEDLLPFITIETEKNTH